MNSIYSIFYIFLFAVILVPAPSAFSQQKQEAGFSSVEERRLHASIQAELESINNQRNLLLMKEKELKTLEAEVDKKITEIDKKLEELKTLKTKIDNLLAQKSAEEQKRIKNLSKIYDKMNPEKAAFAISGMEEQLATDLLANMKVKSAAKVLDRLNRKKATELSSTFSQLQIE